MSIFYFILFHNGKKIFFFYHKRRRVENNSEIIELIPNGNYFEYMAQELIRILNCITKYSHTKLSVFNLFVILKVLLMLKKCLYEIMVPRIYYVLGCMY
jgi:hypothetical protein